MNTLLLHRKGQQITCRQCGNVFTWPKSTPRMYCSIRCKAAWQRTQKPVDRDWLYEKYIVEGRSANEIALIVDRDSKGVWKWLRGYGIPTRPRGGNSSTWFTAGEPSAFMGRKHSSETITKLSEMAKAEGRVPFDPAVGSYMKGRRGADCPSWKGGVTPLRQGFYSSHEWKAVVPQVWKRDNAACQRCGLHNQKGERFTFDIHHIISFGYAPLRAELSNLVLLCEKCHYWVHSNENTEKQFIGEVPCS